VLLVVYVEYFALFIFLFVLCVESPAGQKRRKQHESSDAESDKGQSHLYYLNISISIFTLCLKNEACLVLCKLKKLSQ